MSTGESLLPEPVHVDVDGVQVATYVLAPAQPRGEVVLCHGTPWSAQVWAEAARSLSSGHRVFLWDMPGYGASPMDAEVPVDLASQMVRFARLLEHWGLDRPRVVAHDIGGAVALGAHLLHEREYDALFLWDVVTLEPWGSPFFRLVAEHHDVFARLRPALHRALVAEYVAGAAHRPLPPDWAERLVRPWLGEAGQPAFYRQIAALRPEHTRPVAERLPQVRCGVRIGWGAADPWIPVEQATRLRDLLPGSPPVVLLDGVGHLGPVEATSAVSGVLADWLDWLDWLAADG